MERRILIAGSGGQGILFLGKLLATAAMLDGKEVTWFPAYGAEMRGGTANCTVIISDDSIGSPIVGQADIVVIMNDASLKRFLGRLGSGGTLIYDASVMQAAGRSDVTAIPVPASHMAASGNGTKTANMVLAGALVAASSLVSLDRLYEAVDAVIPSTRKSLSEKNKEIIGKGFDFVKNAQSSHC